jgi:hypothetical protein
MVPICGSRAAADVLYLNIHQGNSRDILRNGQPTIFFRPLLCANIRGY